MRFFRSPTLVTIPRKELYRSDASNWTLLWITLALVTIGTSAILGGMPCFLAALIFVVGLALIVFVISLIRSKFRAGRQAKEAAIAQAKTLRFQQARRCIQVVAERIHELTIDQFIEQVKEARATSGITPEEWVERREEIYNATVYDFVRSDEDLTEHEEAALAAMAQAFKIDSKGNAEARTIDAYRRLRIAIKQQLPVLDSPVPLRKGETCHFVSIGTVLKHTGGTLREGDLVLTNKRVLVVGNGVSEVPFAKLLRIDIDPYYGSINFSVEGKQNPIEIKTRDAIYFGKLAQYLSNPSAWAESATREATRQVVRDALDGIFAKLDRKSDE
ncbi:MAG: hypothetical protein ACYC9N_00605 [Thermoanaerobaculia bacterium]